MENKTIPEEDIPNNIPAQNSQINLEVEGNMAISDNASQPNAESSSSDTNSDEAMIKNIQTNWRTFDGETIASIMSSKVGAAELLRYVHNLSDEQLGFIFPLMSNEQITCAVPQLVLQQQGIAVLSLNPKQIRHFVKSISGSDRLLLLENITLLMMSEGKASENEELQSLIGFIDPLAMAVAVEQESSADKIIEATCIMTGDQIKVLVPLLNIDQIKSTLENIESSEILDIALQMITEEQRKEFIETFEADFAILLEDVENNLESPLTSHLSGDVDSLETAINVFCEKDASFISEMDFINLSTRVLNTKRHIEKTQKESRSFQTKLKVPLLIIDDEHPELLTLYKTLSDRVTGISVRLHTLYQVIDKGNLKDGIIHKLNNKWELIKDRVRENTVREVEPVPASDDDSIFTDSDSSVVLYEAVKAIGNPASIGSIYNITWNQIIETGFRNEEDFKAKGIATLQELENHIKNIQLGTANSLNTAVAAANESV